MKQAFILLTIIALLLTCVSAADPDFSSPVIVHKPLLVTPGEPLMVPLYNGGHGLWSEMGISIADGPLNGYYGLLGAEEFADVPVTMPLIYLLDAEELPVSLYYNGELLDARSLPVEVIWPKQLAVADPVAPGGPEIIILLDATQFEEVLGGVQIEVSLFKGNKELFFDFYGPFYISPQEQFVWRTPLPERYLSPGTYDIRATFYEGNNFLAETTSSFYYGETTRVSFGPILLLILSILLLVLIYIAVDMLYHGRDFSETWTRLRE